MFVATTSLQCIRAIMAEDVPYQLKALMVAIAMNHDYLHRCEYGMEHVRKQAGMGHRTAYRAINRLEELGLIERKKGQKFSKTVLRLTTCGNLDMH